MRKKTNMSKKQEFVDLLRFTGRTGIDLVLPELENIGFFEAPAAAKKHLAYEGGLVEHSLTVYRVLLRLAEDMRTLRPDMTIHEDSLKIVALLHDVCKATRYRWNDEKKEYESDYSVMPVGHGEKSVIMLLRMGLELHDDEIMAIRWHMGAWDLSLHSYEAQKNFVEAGSQSPLVPLLQTADTLAALIVEKGK
jgi:putative nucleotidyltransferase with HDIG domain